MPKTQQDIGVILRLRPLGEYDSLITLFSQKYGKKTLVAKGLRRPTSKMCGIIQPFSTVKIEESVPNSEKSLGKMIHAELLSAPPNNIFPSYFFISEVAEKLAQEGQENQEFFNLLCHISSAQKEHLLPAIFLLKTLTVFGYFPLYKTCSKTHKKLSGPAYWLHDGQIMTKKGNNQIGNTSLDFEEIKVIAFWQQSPLQVCEKVQAEQQTLKKIEKHCLQFLKEEQDIHLKTTSLL